MTRGTAPMDPLLAALEQAFAVYRQEIEACEKKSRPTDGLLGFGHSLKDDSCHDRFDGRVEQAVRDIRSAGPSSETAGQAVRMLILRDDGPAWPLAAQWMLRAVERHSTALIPLLDAAAAAALEKEYAARYPRWDRLPAQKEVLKALKLRKETP